MKNLDELLNALRDITNIGTVKYKDIKPKFEDIAHTLLCDCVIVKGDIIYRIREIEFYLFRKDYQDFVTYPRTCNAGDWYFHNSGVDLAFQSSCTIPNANPEKDSFGGVLIRTIEQLDKNYQPIPGKKLYDGPLKVVNELFDKFSAICPGKDLACLAVSEGLFNDKVISWKNRYIPNMATYSKCTKKYLPGCSYDSTKGMDACSFFTKSTSKCSNSSSYKKLISIE